MKVLSDRCLMDVAAAGGMGFDCITGIGTVAVAGSVIEGHLNVTSNINVSMVALNLKTINNSCKPAKPVCAPKPCLPKPCRR